MSLVSKLSPRIDALLETIKTRLGDGEIADGDIYAVLMEVVGDTVLVANEVPNASVDDIKELAAYVAQKLYDDVIAPLDLPYVPNWIEPTVDEAVGKLVTPVIEGMVAGLIALIKKHGISVEAH